jgi:hypothetical protein
MLALTLLVVVDVFLLVNVCPDAVGMPDAGEPWFSDMALTTMTSPLLTVIADDTVDRRFDAVLSTSCDDARVGVIC